MPRNKIESVRSALEAVVDGKKCLLELSVTNGSEENYFISSRALQHAVSVRTCIITGAAPVPCFMNSGKRDRGNAIEFNINETIKHMFVVTDVCMFDRSNSGNYTAICQGRMGLYESLEKLEHSDSDKYADLSSQTSFFLPAIEDRENSEASRVSGSTSEHSQDL
jgi:hypothetical protein